MRTRLCLVRHGETDWNAERRVQGQIDIPLNAKGRRQASSLARGLVAERFSAVYSSDLRRAMQTAEPSAGVQLTARRDFALPNAGLNWLEGDAGGWRVAVWADVSHIAQALDELPG